MADRYWVGGSGSWNSTAKWSTTSGGAGGASVPTAVDNAIFDAASNTTATHFTVTVTDNATCANLTFTPVAADGVTEFAVGTGFVIAGTFSTTGTQGNRRAWFRSSTYGLTRDMQIATIGVVSDVDFRDIRITGTGGTLTGTRVGNLRGNVGITFSTPKNCYRIGTGNWSDNQWSDQSGGSVSTDNFPLAQDTAIINESTTAGTHTMNAAIPYAGAVDMSARTSALTLSFGAAQTIYGDWKNGSGTALSGAQTLTFSGRNAQGITSAGKTFSGAITIDSYGGTVELADALDIGTNTLTVTEGAFDTKNYSVAANALSSNSSGVRTINLGSSSITLKITGSAVNIGNSTNLTFNAGTSTITIQGVSTTAISGPTSGPAITFYNVSFIPATANANIAPTISGSNIFNNLLFTPHTSASCIPVSFNANTTINGTLTVAGASPVRRLFVRSGTLGTSRTLTVATLSATDCDFRDITIAGTAANSSPTRAGDCGGNSGINFPAPKTIYWNLSGAQNWSATAWATGTGGTPNINNFPLAQDTAVFDEAVNSVTGTITIDGNWNIGTFDASARTSAMTLTVGTNTPAVHGNWKFGSGVTSSSTSGTINFLGRGTSTITSNGVQFGCNVLGDSVTGIVTLADALSLNSARTLTLTSGTFDAVTYNVTTGLVATGSGVKTLKMGSGTWTLSGTGTVWDMSGGTTTFYKGTANITLSDTSTSARAFVGSAFSYNKLTIGGTTGTSTLTISNNNFFTELASTKTVAHTIALGTTTQTFGKWTVTGTSGNVVTLTGTGTLHLLVGACTDGIDYLAMGSIGFSASSPGEFYAGANSTGTAGAPVYRTAKPADSTRYWVGGTGNWSDTARWSTTSGTGSGASVPRSHDDVVFDSGSNATAYTATVDTVTGGARCKSLTIAGPASGNVTLAGTAALRIHDDITLPATGLTRTYTGAITLSGSTSGKTITTNGVALGSPITVRGVGCEWTLGSALNIGSNGLTILEGLFDCDTYNLTSFSLQSATSNPRTIDLGSATITLSGDLSFGTSEDFRANLTFIAGTSQITFTAIGLTFSGNNQTFYNISATATSISTIVFNGDNTFNNLSITGRASAGLANIILAGNQTINGTLTLSAGTNATMRHFVRSDTIGTTRTLTCAAVSLTDADFRDVTIAGAAAPVSGTRLGNCKGNSGINFDGAKTVYWRAATAANWGSDSWSGSEGGAFDITQFPLAQDTAVFPSGYPNSGVTVTVNAAYNIGTIDMSARTTNTMTLDVGSSTPTIYGNWINGTGTTLAGLGLTTFAGRGSQTITSAGKTFTQGLSIITPGGSVTLQDAFVSNRDASTSFTLSAGTFDAATYNVTFSGASSQVVLGSATNTRTIAVGSGTWSLGGGTGAWNVASATGLTVTGTGTISLTSASAKTFVGGSLSYTDITINQGGAGSLTFGGNNTFKDITNTYKATGAATIAFSTSTQRLSMFTAAGEAGRLLTLTGSSSTNPCTLILNSGVVNSSYLTLTGVRAYPLTDSWYAGTTSTNNGSLGWAFEAAPVITPSAFFQLFF